jgi:hypothetical protein
MLESDRLPDEHFHVFKAITKYAVVDKEQVYERLGHYGVKRTTKGNRPVKGYLTPYRDIPKQLCNGTEFRDKIAGSGATKTKNIIKKNYKDYGIPQGAPISDLLANLYLLDFDVLVLRWARALGGIYFRYSDDILIVLPGGKAVGLDFEERVRNAIGNFGRQLSIKEEKSSVFVFTQDGERQRVVLVKGTKGRNGVEYLGFRYDGRLVYLRNSTVSNLYRKVTRAARRDANALARRYPDKDLNQLRKAFNYDQFIATFGRVEDFEELNDDYRNWTFWTYANKAADILGPVGRPILRQLRKHRSIIRRKIDNELDRAVRCRSQAKLRATNVCATDDGVAREHIPADFLLSAEPPRTLRT